MQKSRVIMDNRSALRGEWFGKVLQFGLKNAIQASSFFACLSPRSARVSEKNVARPRPHFAASAHCRSLEVCIRSVPKVVGCRKCSTSVLPWTIDLLFAGNGLASCCSSAWRMRSSPAAPSLAFPPLGPGLGEKCVPHFGASARRRSLEVRIRNVPKVAGRDKFSRFEV
jgi:hypothetical protein